MGIGQFFKSLLDGGKVDIASRYEILREAVSGTMSNFHMARDRETDQIVGLKILDKAKTDALEARFKGLEKPTEGEIAMSFKHPRIVNTFSHGITTNDEQFLVMEFLDGPGLNSLIIGRSKLLDGNRLTLARQAAEALEAVHEAGFIHRDICPRNFVCSKDATSLKLIDFGLTVPAEKEFMLPGNRTGHAELHGAGSRSPQADRPAARYLRLRRFDVRAVCVRAAVAAGRHRPGRDGARHERTAAAAGSTTRRSIRRWKRRSTNAWKPSRRIASRTSRSFSRRSPGCSTRTPDGASCEDF